MKITQINKCYAYFIFNAIEIVYDFDNYYIYYFYYFF